MKKLKYGIFFFVMILLSACSAVAESDIKKIGDTDSKMMEEYVGTFVGNNSTIIEIIQVLPGAETMKEVDLREGKLKVFYGAKKGSLPQTEIFEFWFDENDAMEKNFFFNSVYLALLVPNSTKYTLAIEDFSFSIERDEMISAIAERFPTFPLEESAENEEAIGEFIRKHEEEIQEWTTADVSRNKFFLTHPIVYTSRQNE